MSMSEPVSRIPGLEIWQPRVFADERGAFLEVFRAQALPEAMVQSNHSQSRAGVLRGLHYHRHQADLWYVVKGSAQVGLVDLRDRTEPLAVETFVIGEDQPTAVYIPPGVAHGYLALTDMDMIYWVTSEYDPADEHGVAWDDAAIGLPWRVNGTPPVLSERDLANPPLSWDQIPSFS
jgi:dTDP-4-dehydrorhamnose 3,5-epimerase